MELTNRETLKEESGMRTGFLTGSLSDTWGDGKLDLQVVTDVSSFLSLRDEWDRLVDASPASIFQTFDWQWLWWKYFGDRLHLHIIVFRHKGKLVGLAPLYLDVYSVFGVKLHCRLRFLGGGVEDRRSQWDLAQFGPSDYLDVFALPEFQAEVANSFLAYVRKETWLDEAELENIPHNSLLVKELIPLVKREGHPYKYVQDHVCPRITLPATLEEYLRTRSAKFRYQLSQTRKAATTQGLFSIKPVESTSDLHEALLELIRLHQMRWNRIGYPGMFADIRFRRFQEEVTARFLERGWLWFKTVHTNGSCIAARLGFKFKDSISDYVAGFDDQSPGAKRRPGFALILSMMEDALQHKMCAIDLLRGYETYKFEFTDEILNDWKIVIPNPASARALRARLYRATHYLEFLLRKMLFEWSMFKVHFREHRFPKFLVRYVAFRVKKLSEKIVNELKMAKLIPDDH
jgi:CelD/BcsL family acetyltransferase involved in cellulose biosynthesis